MPSWPRTPKRPPYGWRDRDRVRAVPTPTPPRSTSSSTSQVGSPALGPAVGCFGQAACICPENGGGMGSDRPGPRANGLLIGCWGDGDGDGWMVRGARMRRRAGGAMPDNDTWRCSIVVVLPLPVSAPQLHTDHRAYTARRHDGPMVQLPQGRDWLRRRCLPWVSMERHVVYEGGIRRLCGSGEVLEGNGYCSIVAR